jgi:glycosyltransferase involved in cell wall biosynthesis
MHLSVIICTWNRCKTLPAVLASLQSCVVPENLIWEVLVVDNNSTDQTRAVIDSFSLKTQGRFRYIFESRQGKSNALNAGIQNSRGDILALTDDDVTVHPEWIAQVYDAFQQFDCAGIGGRIVPVWTCSQPAWIDFDGPFRHVAFGGIVRFEKGDAPLQLSGTATGANMAFRRSVVEKHGLFRTDLSGNHADRRRLGDLLGGEDTEYCQRLLNAGEKLYYAPKAIVYHPVEEHRLRKKYLQSFAFYYGRYSMRIGGLPPNPKSYFGVPRYLFPVAMKFLGKWISSFGIQRRFFYKLELCETLGRMAEGRRLIKNAPGRQLLEGLTPTK